MAKRQQAVPAQLRAGAGENTARVVVHKSVVPGWFWGVLGFVSVLAIGFGALLFAAKTGAFAVGPAAPERSTEAAAAPPAPPAAPPAAPQIEPLAPSAPAVPVVEPRPRSVSHPIKLARSPEPRRAVAGAPAAKSAAKNDAPAAKNDAPVAKNDAPAADDAPAAKKAADKPAADDDQVVHVHHATASDQDDDDDDN
jgi:hypothetical protein